MRISPKRVSTDFDPWDFLTRKDIVFETALKRLTFQALGTTAKGTFKRPVSLFKELVNASSFHALTPVTVLLN